jgi:hypothetical protein
MTQQFTRRSLLRASLVCASVAGAGLAWGSMPASAAMDPAGGPPKPPDVPGMRGNPLNNEFWFQFDEAFLYHPSPTVRAALTAMTAKLGSVQRAFALAWQEHRANGTFPDGFVAEFLPVKEPLTVVADAQLDLMRQFYRHNDARLLRAFADFGQGLLYDPRRNPGQRVHMMDYPNGTEPPGAYHVWHAIIRAQTLMGIAPTRWNFIDRLVGLAWAAQSIAKPVTDATDNPPLPRAVLARQAVSWLRRTPTEMDSQFDSFPYPPGIS